MKALLGREPALWLALISALIQGVSGFFFHLTADQQGVLNAVAVAAIGIVTAAAVSGDQLVPAILAGVKALLALGLAFGAHLDPSQQSIIMILATAVAAMFVRTQVVAPVPPVPPVV